MARGFLPPRNNLMFPRGYIKPAQPVLDLSHPLSHGLLSCWLLGGRPKSLGIDIGPRGAHMVPSGTINQVSSHHGGTASQVTSADTTSRYVSASFQLKSTDSYSISFWANVRAATGVNSRLYEFSAGVEMYGPGNSNYNITNDDGSHNITPSFTPTVGVWFHVVVTCATGGTAQCYINGSLLASGSIGAIPNTTGGLSVGNNVGLARFFDGSLEGYRWYNRIISAQEVLWLYAEPYAGIYNAIPEYLVGATGGNVTVAITGNSSTASQGTLGVKNTHALTGNASTASEGTLRGGQPLHGNQCTTSQGTVSPKITVALTGNVMTAGRGTLTPVTGFTAALTGNSSTAAQGTLGVKHSNALAGNQSAAFEGAITPSTAGNVTVALTGNQMRAFQGTLTPSAPIIIVDTHDGGEKRRKAHDKLKKKRDQEDRDRDERRRHLLIDAFEQIIEGDVSRETNIQQVIEAVAEEAISSPEIQQKSDFDFAKWLTNLDNAQRLLDDYLEVDDEEALLLL